MQLDCSNDMPVHISVCTSYDLNALMPVVWKLWCLCVSVFCHRNERLVFGAMNHHYILCEIRKKCKGHLCSAHQGLWGRGYEIVKCFGVA